MKSSKFIPAVLLALTSAHVQADTYTCKPITGTFQQLVVDPACTILQSKANYFPDANFYAAPGTCFSGQLQGTLGDIAVTGKSYSGLLANGLGKFTVASAIRLYAGSVELGRVFTKDVVFDADATELLTVVGGSRTFKGGYGNIEILGSALYQPSSNFAGTLCTEN